MSVFRPRTIGLLLLALGCGNAQDSLPEHQKASSGSPSENRDLQELSGLYYGRDANGWATLLLLREDSSGVAYDPGGLAQLCNVVDSARKISFREAPIAGSETYFELELRPPDRLVGETWTRHVGSSQLAEKSPIELDRLQFMLSVEKTQRRDSSGVFSNVAYSTEGGDLNGAELVLVGADTRWFGLLTEFEGTPQGPYTARLMRARADTLWVEREDSIESPIKIAWRGDSLVVVGQRVLKRRASISELLSGLPRFRCQ